MKSLRFVKMVLPFFSLAIAANLVVNVAKGSLLLSISDNVGNSIVIDGITGVVSESGSVTLSSITETGNVIQFSGSVGVFQIELEKAISINISSLGSISLITSLTAPAGTKTKLTISATDTSYAASSASVDYLRTVGTLAGGAVSLDGYFDPADIAWGTGGLHFALGPYSAIGNGVITNFDELVGAPFGYGKVPYSITGVLVATPDGSDPYSLNSFSPVIQTPVPEAMTMFLTGLFSVIAFGSLRRRFPSFTVE